jgi:hypothetical protein
LLPGADRYTGQLAFDMWTEVAGGQLSNTMQLGCSWEGIATQWASRTVPADETLVLSPNSGVNFIAQNPFAAATVPTVSGPAVLAMIGGMAIVAFFLIRERLT